MIAILAATIIAYLPAIRAPFVLDDVQSIPGNPTIRALWPLSVPSRRSPGNEEAAAYLARTRGATRR